MNLIKIWNSAKEIANYYNYSYKALNDYLNNKRKTHEYKGFIWYYIKKDTF